MQLLAAAEHASTVADVASTAAYSIVRDSVYGALLVAAVGGIVWLIKRLLAAQDQRVADQIRANESMDRTREKTAALMEQMTRALSEVNGALERMSDLQGDSVRAINDVRTALSNIATTLDSIIRDAVRGSRRSAPPQPRHQEPRASEPRQQEVRPGAYSLKDLPAAERVKR